MSDEEKEKLKKELKLKISKALQKKREEQKQSLADVSHALKIRVSQLQFIEQGRWEEIPSGVYLKSFLVKYANFLGLNGKDLVGPYFHTEGDAEEEVVPEVTETTDQSDTRARVWWIYAGVGLVLLLGIFKFLSKDADLVKTSEMNQTKASVSIEVENEISQKENHPDAEVAPIEAHTIAIFSPYQLWVRIEAQDKNFEGFISENSTWVWRANGQMDIRLGHTKDINVYFDEKPVKIEDNQRRVTLPHAS